MRRTPGRPTRRWKNRRNGADGSATTQYDAGSAAAAAITPAAQVRRPAADVREHRGMSPYEMSYDVAYGYALDRSITIP
jgi:hypothetical protein